MAPPNPLRPVAVQQWHIHHMHATMRAVKPTSSLDPAQLVLRARTAIGLSQRDFGALVGKSQGLISKYESSRVVPPAHIVIHCMHILGGSMLPQPDATQGWDAVHTALTQLQQALASVAPTSRRSQRTI